MVLMDDEQYKELYVAWARHKYHDESIVDVQFSLGTRGPYSDTTPDVDTYVQIWVGYLPPGVFGYGGRTFEERDVHALIRELNEFIVDQLSRAYEENK